MKAIIFSALLSITVFTSCKNEKPVDISTEISSIENGLELAIQIKGETPKQYNLSERMMYHKIPGVSIAVVKNGKIRWAKGYGIANTINGKEVDVNTLFQAGSTSKAIAALSTHTAGMTVSGFPGYKPAESWIGNQFLCGRKDHGFKSTR